jgi:hypothetical protein
MVLRVHAVSAADCFSLVQAMWIAQTAADDKGSKVIDMDVTLLN